MNETYVTIVGNAVGDPIPHATRSGVPFVTFRLASTVRRPAPGGGGEYVDGGTSFFNVSAFRSLGVNVHRSIKKGQPVIVNGRLRVNNWVNGERSGTSVEIDAYHVGHDLVLGVSDWVKRTGPVSFADSDRLSDPAVQAAHQGVEEPSGYLDGEPTDEMPDDLRDEMPDDLQGYRSYDAAPFQGDEASVGSLAGVGS